MKVKILADCAYGKKDVVVEIPNKEAEILEHAGIVAETVSEQAPVDDIEDFLKASSTFLTADLAKEGDVIEITGMGYIDSGKFDKESIILPIKYAENEYSLRIGPKNAKRLAKSFGTTKLSEWVGRKMEVVSIEDYAGLKAKGMILKGIKERGAGQ